MTLRSFHFLHLSDSALRQQSIQQLGVGEGMDDDSNRKPSFTERAWQVLITLNGNRNKTIVLIFLVKSTTGGEIVGLVPVMAPVRLKKEKYSLK